jgi:hypothetical protein
MSRRDYITVWKCHSIHIEQGIVVLWITIQYCRFGVENYMILMQMELPHERMCTL